MKSNDVKTIFNLALRLTVIVAVVVLMLAAVNAFTADKIANNTAETRNEACGALIAGGKFDELDTSALNVDYSDIKNADKDSVVVYSGTVDGEIAGYCVEVTGKGYSSDGISLIVGVSADGEKVLGVKVVTAAETSGIGTKVLADDELNNFVDMESSDVAEYDGVSGATRTTRGVRDAVRAAVKAVNAYIEQGGAN